jgi:hypothetical protein
MPSTRTDTALISDWTGFRSFSVVSNMAHAQKLRHAHASDQSLVEKWFGNIRAANMARGTKKSGKSPKRKSPKKANKVAPFIVPASTLSIILQARRQQDVTPPSSGKDEESGDSDEEKPSAKKVSNTSLHPASTTLSFLAEAQAQDREEGPEPAAFKETKGETTTHPTGSCYHA